MAQRTLTRRWGIVWGIVALAGSSCTGFEPDLADWPCDNGACADGYVCHPQTNLCVPEIPLACDGNGTCPSSTLGGMPCEELGAFIPCVDGATACESGCRTCVDYEWSACVVPGCVPENGGVEIECNGVDEDCDGHDAEPEGGCTSCSDEICDGVDNDCDGSIDEEDATGCTTFWSDLDRDGFGADTSRCLCAAAAPYDAIRSDDCDNADRHSHPEASEVCDGNDNDCDASVPSHELDGDGDGFVACADWLDSQEDDPQINGGGDCDDGDATSFPGAEELCDGNDNDCSGDVPAIEMDLDGDHAVECEAWSDPQGDDAAIVSGGDCDGGSAARHPGAIEVCDGIDNDCDDVVDGGLGAACACAEGGAPATIETCGDGVDNDCNDDVDEEPCAGPWWQPEYGYRIPIVVSTGSVPVFTGHSLAVTLDHASLVADGKSRFDGDDVRVVFDDGATLEEVDRVVDPDSTWGSDSTRVWFAAPQVIPAESTTANFSLYYGHPAAGAPPCDETRVFDFADFFDRDDDTDVGRGWLVDEAGSTDAAIRDRQLYFERTAVAEHGPVASRVFGPYVGRIVARVGFAWTPQASDGHRIYVQLGFNPPAVPATAEAAAQEGVAVNLLSAAASQWDVDEDPHHDISNAGFGYSSAGATRQVDVVSGPTSVRVEIDMAAGAYNLTLDRGDSARSYEGLEFSSAMSSINTIRLMTYDLDSSTWSADRGFSYVIVHREVNPEVEVYATMEIEP